MKALILPAGQGKRFYPFNHYHAKPMFPLCNRPITERLVERTVASGLTEVGIVVGHCGGTVRAHFDDDARFGARIFFIDQPDPLGTGHAVTCARSFIGDDDVLVLPGDVWFREDVLPALLDALEGATSGVGAR